MKIMKTLFILSVLIFSGCNSSVVESPKPVLEYVTEKETGKTFSVKAGNNLLLRLTVDIGEDYFWSFSRLDDGIEVVSDNKKGTKQNILLKVNKSGTIKLQYCLFKDNGLKVLNNVSFSIVASK